MAKSKQEKQRDRLKVYVFEAEGLLRPAIYVVIASSLPEAKSHAENYAATDRVNTNTLKVMGAPFQLCAPKVVYADSGHKERH